MIWVAQDRVLSDVPAAILAAGERIRPGLQVVIPNCGHAPADRTSRLVNRLISRFLRDKLDSIPPDLAPSRFLRPTPYPLTPPAACETSPHSVRLIQ